MHLERALEARELRVREPRRDRLRQRDERHLVRDGDEREVEPLRLVGERGRRLGPAEADAEREPGEAVAREAAHVLAMRPRQLADAESRRDQQLASLEPRRRVGELGDVDPADRVVGAGRARSELQPEARQVRDVTDGQHRLGGAAWTPRPRRYSLLAAGSKQSRSTAMRRECVFPTSCRRTARGGTTPGPLRSAVRGARESPRVSSRAHVRRRRPRSPRALRRARRRDAATRGHARRGRAGRGRRRHRLPRLRRRDRLPEHRATASRPSSPRSTSRSTVSCTSASWSAPTSPTSRSAAGSPSTRPAAASAQKSILVNSGAEAIENAVKIARAATGRPAVVVFENGFHGRTLLTMAMTSKVRPYKAGFGPFPRRGLPRRRRRTPTAASTPTPRSRRSSTCSRARSRPRRSPASCSRPVQGEGGFIPMPPTILARLRELCDAHGILFVADEVQSGVGRTGPMWAIEHSGVAPDLLVSGKSLGGGLPLAAVTGRAEVMDAPGPGRARRHVRRQPRRLRRGRGRRSTRSPSRSSGPRGRSSARRSARGWTSSPRGTSDRRRARARSDAGARAARAEPRPGPGGRPPPRSSAACCCSRAASTGTCCGCCRR